MSHTPSIASPEEAIAHALAEAATYGEYEMCYPSSDDSPHRVCARVVIYPCGLQAWYVPGDPFEWIPVAGAAVLDALYAAFEAAADTRPPIPLDDAPPDDDMPF